MIHIRRRILSRWCDVGLGEGSSRLADLAMVSGELYLADLLVQGSISAQTQSKENKFPQPLDPTIPRDALFLFAIWVPDNMA